MKGDYLPREAAEFYYRDSEEDRKLADAFELVATLIEASGDTDEFQLYLSTCRNAFMAINAMFVDIREALGHGKRPSRISQVIYHLSHGISPVVAVEEPLTRVKDSVVHFDLKQRCWKNRVKHQEFIEHHLGQLKHSQQSRLREILFSDLKQDRGAAANEWPLEYVSISTEDPARLVTYWDTLRSARDIIDAFHQVAVAMVPVGRHYESLKSDEAKAATEPRLFGLLDGPTANKLWEQYLAERAEPLLAIKRHWESLIKHRSSSVIIPLDFETHCPESAPSGEGFKEHFLELGQKLLACLEAVHATLAEVFRPNVGYAPLPDVFKVDLREMNATTVRLSPETVPLSVVKMSCSRPAKVVVAIPQFAPPWSLLDEARYQYKSQADRALVGNLAMTAIEVAARSGADIVVFPELFFPRDHLSGILSMADKHNIVIVGGEEATWDSSGVYRNSVVVRFPGKLTEHRQYKRCPSSFEPAAIRGQGGQVVFEDSPVGTFSVLVCSDFQDPYSLMALYGAERPLDFLIVCSMNEHAELWQAMALADANRAYCHVIISNNHPQPKDGWSNNGSGVIRPGRSLPEAQLSPVSAEGHPCGETGRQLQTFHVTLGEVVRDRVRPNSGYTTPPVTRLVRLAGSQ